MLYLLSLTLVDFSSVSDDVVEVWLVLVIHLLRSWLLNSVSFMIQVFRWSRFVWLVTLLSVTVELASSLLLLSLIVFCCGGGEPLELELFVNVVSGV